MRSAESVKGKLKNLTRESGKNMQELLTAYGIERTIFRISHSPFAERFTLKGGVFLYAVFGGDFPRATQDIDFLARNISNSREEVKAVFKEIFSMKCDDPLVFDLESIDASDIAELKEYHGVRVSIVVYLDRTRIPISIDVGFGDVVYPNQVKMNFPTLFDDESPSVFAYSLYSVIAEKFEAIVSLGIANSRYKDFYDICLLVQSHDFEGRDLEEAVKRTFEQRETSFSDIVIFEDGFAENQDKQMGWKTFIRKKRAILSIEFPDAIEVIKKFISPVVNAIETNQDFSLIWNKDDMAWHK